jgi:hypothetical protein
MQELILPLRHLERYVDDYYATLYVRIQDVSRLSYVTMAKLVHVYRLSNLISPLD